MSNVKVGTQLASTPAQSLASTESKEQWEAEYSDPNT